MLRHHAAYDYLLFVAVIALFFTFISPTNLKANSPVPFTKNFDDFTAAGFDPNPTVRQLDSDIWIVTDLSDGSLAFGDTQPTGDFARGLSTGGEIQGGIYAFDVGGGNIIFGIQPTGEDFTPGDIILRLQNNTGTIISELDIAYGLWFLNDQERANSLNFSYSTDNVNYAPVAPLDFTTPELSDALGWQSTLRSTSITGVAPIGNWIINEIHADPDPINGDANGDGDPHNTRDEFVEIINNSGTTVDISGWTLSDGVGVRHAFTAGTVVNNQCAVVVFAGGTPTGTFGDAIVQTATSGQLGLNNGGDTLTLSDGVSDQAAYTYGTEGGDNQSLTRTPDITGPDPLIRHSTAPGSGGSLYSPGTRVDGSAFSVCGLPDLPPIINATTPVSNATNVAITSTINMQFSESVAATVNAFSLECPAGATIGFSTAPTLPGSADTFTLTPNVDLPYSTTCTLSVTADQITDLDGVPHPMPTDYSFTFDTAPAPAPAATILISEFLYDGQTASTEGDEFIELCNPNATPADLTGYKVGDEETLGGGEGMYQLPDGTTLLSGACLVIGKSTSDFQARFGFSPDLEIGGLSKYTAWATGNWSLANSGDELLLLGPNDEIIDSVAFRNGDYTVLGLEPSATAPAPHSLQRVWPVDTNSMPHDFVRADPTPGVSTLPPAAPAVPVPPATLPNGMNAYWGHLHAHTTYSDGSGPPYYALALARAAGLHYYAITDHGWWISPSQWTSTLSQTTQATVPGEFVALRGIEWTHGSAGHINIFNNDTLLQRTNPLYDDLSDFYTWLAANPTAIAQFNHPDPSYGGTFSDFAFHSAASQMVFMQEIGNSAQKYTTYEPSFIQSNTIGWRTAPTNNSDTHSAKWGTDTPARTGIVAPALTETDLLDAMRARRVFATEDSNLALTLRSNDLWMGTVLTNTGSITLTVDVVDPDPEPITLYLYDDSLLLATVPLSTSTGQWHTTVNTLPGHFYWIKAIQADGDAAYTAPLWIDGERAIETVLINELLPEPRNIDWDGNGVADSNDELIELYNPLDRPVGLGGWQLNDTSNVIYNIPLGVSIPAKGYVALYKAETGIALNNSGDTLTLKDPVGRAVDAISYDHSPGSDDSWCRLPNGGPIWSDNCTPTPGSSNMEKVETSAEPLKVKIFDAKRLTLDAWVVIKGRVTAQPGVLGSRIMYIQDDTAGIKIYLPKDHYLFFNLGDKVEVEGNLDLFREEFEIEVDERGDVSFLEAGPPVLPLPIATTSMLEPYEGMLVQLQGQAVNFRGRSTFWIDDGSDPAKIVIRQSTGIKKPFIERGTPVTVVGIVSQYSDPANPSRDDYRLLLRYQTDLVLPEIQPAPAPANWPKFLPETGN